ncbi:Signal transduction histidine kinase [Serratia sp. JKS296]|uniref:ATP-binding response regulator n=1 Tax=Serratia sp. JKS296 TaxID=1938824 RepID=UPI000BCE2B46|nr:hybrid sensor histidine kinase/response regulator [Serratia sp. JKS296]SOD79943.1 Signal transduction histidine kinase [Serratia sp. JKS296]
MKKKFLFLIIGIAIALIFVISTIIKYNSMLSEKSLYAISGTQENYSWAIAKFSIQLSEFYALVKNNNQDLDKIREKLDILYSRVLVIRQHSESTAPLYTQPGYKENIDTIYHKLEEIDSYVNTQIPDLNKVIQLVNQIEPYSKKLNNLADHAEVSQRTKALEDYKQKRKQLYILLSITTILITALFLITAIYLYKLNRLLDSEKKAFNNKNAFLGVLGHELNTSLQAIMSSVELIVLRKDNGDIKQLERLETASMKMAHQMKGLAEFAKVDNGNVEISNSTFNLSKLVVDTVNDCISIAKKPTIEVSLRNITNEYIESDPSRIMQIVENLVTNAIKYTDDGFVKIDAYLKNPTSLIIMVEDSGRGIPKDKLKSIFTPFIRVGVNNKTPGFGMGLAIVNGVIKAMNGTIEVKSDLGKGSLFTVIIPVKVSSPEKIEALNESESVDFKYKGLKVLIIDDNEMVCESLAAVLQRDFRVEFITSPERALEKLLRKPYDIILSDLQMPVMTGNEIHNKVRSLNGPNRKTPFIFISAYTAESPVPGVTLLTKPVRVRDISKEVNFIMEKTTKN